MTKTDLLLPLWAETSISTQTQMITSSRYMLIVETAMTHGDIRHSKKPELVLVRLELFLAVALVLFVTKVGLLSKEGRRRNYIFFLSWREWLDGKMSNTRQHPWDKNDRFPQIMLVMRRQGNEFHLVITHAGKFPSLPMEEFILTAQKEKGKPSTLNLSVRWNIELMNRLS